MEDNATAYINGIWTEDGMSLGDFALEEAYEFFCEYGESSENGRLMFIQCGNIPAMYIDTYSGNMDYIHARKGNEESGSIRIYTNDGTIDYWGALEFIKGRGNATWDDPKKPYSLKLDLTADLLGMGSAEKWILLANAYDAAHIRNQIAFDLADAAGMEYTPDYRWVDLYLNGAYAGLYLLTERNEVHEQRVDISLSDSFLVSLELGYRLKAQGYPYVTSDNGKFLRIHHCSIGEEQLGKIWQSLENALLAEDGIDPVTGKSWSDLLDVDSWAMRMLLDEILVNYDGGSISQYFYYDAIDGTGKVKAGPVWDMDNCLAQGGWQAVAPNAIMTYREHILYDSDLSLFFKLYEKPEFRERVKELYWMQFLPHVENLINEDIQAAADYISRSANVNNFRWDISNAGEETDKICAFLQQRIDFLNDYWFGDNVYHTVHVANGQSVWACFAVRDGDCIPDVLETAEDWQIIGTETPFDITQPIYENVTIVQKNTDFELMKAFLNNEIEVQEEVPEESDSSLYIAEGFLVAFIAALLVLLVIDRKRIGVKNAGKEYGVSDDK